MSKHNEKELKNIVKHFKHNELKILLGFAKRNNNGRKSVLLERTHEMIDSGCTTSIVFKINDLNSKKKDIHKAPKRCSTNNKLNISDTVNYNESKSTHEMDGISVPVNNSQLQECPLVKFAKLPFYEQMDEIVRPAYLKSNSFSGSSNTIQFNFKLYPQQAKSVTDGQELINECMIEYKLQIILRFCLNQENAEQVDNLPSSLYISVNNKVISLPSLQGLPSSPLDFKRPGRPLDITHACNLTQDASNSVSITWNQPFQPMMNHCFTIVISSKLSSADLLEKLKFNSVRDPNFTRTLIKEKLAADADAEISTTCLKISLICPLGKTRLAVPVRSIDCSHLQCFDASTYLQMNEKKPTWICPICDKAAKFESLIIDGLLSEILSEVENFNEIQFFENGEWMPIVKKKEEVYASPDESIVCLDIPDSPCSSNSAKTIVLGSDQHDSRNSRGKHLQKKQIAMVDLTCDTDTEEEEEEEEDDEDGDGDGDGSLYLLNRNNKITSKFMGKLF